MDDQIVFFTGSSHPTLGDEICRELEIPKGNLSLKAFPDGELSVEILEEVEGRDVFVLQSLGGSPNHHLMELLILVDALKRGAAKRVTAIIPYLSYSRQDRRDRPGTPITAKLVANLISSAGVDHLITCDLHSDQIEGFFEIPVTHLRCQQLLAHYAKKEIGEDCIVVAPDIGSIRIAEAMAKELNVELAVIKKERIDATQVRMKLIGDVANKQVLIPDDLCSTAGTVIAAAKLCKEKGAGKIIAATTHGLFVGGALEKIESSSLLTLLVTNTIPPKQASSKIKYISVAKMLAEAIKLNEN